MNLTGLEHVKLYAAIKGIPKEFISEAARSKLAEVGLDEFDSNRLSSQYSGGMKRKLSVACATIGNPEVSYRLVITCDNSLCNTKISTLFQIWKIRSFSLMSRALGWIQFRAATSGKSFQRWWWVTIIIQITPAASF